MAEPYYKVLSSAINDLIENGYDSPSRISYWAQQIRDSAEAQLGPVGNAEAKLREALASSYKRSVDQGTILKRHPGVSAFQLERIHSLLRLELERRFLAAKDLIQLNREEAISDTIRRFKSWSTSIPSGGTPTAVRSEVKRRIRKSLVDLPFEDRRLTTDQSNKLISAVSEIIALENGALAGIWNSRWREPGYLYREDHKHRDDEVYPVAGNWALAKGFMKKAGQPFTDEIEQPGEWSFCGCYYTWIYSLKGLPKRFLTKSGEQALMMSSRQAVEL